MVALCLPASKINLTMNKILSFIFFTTFTFIQSFAQNRDSLIHALLLNIASLQVDKKGEFYAGEFPGYRSTPAYPHKYVPDNNIFYTAVSAFALRNMMPYLNDSDKII